jgi:hypothetical protein
MQRNSNNNGAQAQVQVQGAQPACAACKHQRKKCTEVCVLAPYFPADRIKEFQAVHKFFGVSNVTKIVKNLKEEERRYAVDSLVWEASCRLKDPVLGPYGEYRRVFDELKIYQNQNQNQNQVIQLPGQGGIGYKVGPGLIGWSTGTNGIQNKVMGIGTGGILTGNTLNYIHDNGNGIVDSNMYAYPGVPLQQNSISGFNQQYYLPGTINIAIS